MDTEMNDAGQRVPVMTFQALEPLTEARGDADPKRVRIRRAGDDWVLLVAREDKPAIRVQESLGDGPEVKFVHPDEILAVLRDGARVHPADGLSEQTWESFLERAGLDATRQAFLGREENWEPFP